MPTPGTPDAQRGQTSGTAASATARLGGHGELVTCGDIGRTPA
jgi:hypothetical protein